MEHYDLILRGGTVIDGSGCAGVVGDVAVRKDRIVAVSFDGELDNATAADDRRIDNLVVAPGFIDTHTHDDRAVLIDPDMAPKVSQGVTTVIVGNCGISLAPLALENSSDDILPPLNLLGEAKDYCYAQMADYAEAVAESKPRLNVAALVGHMSLRLGCMDDLSKKASDTEIAAMQECLQEALDAGAIGFSTGLFYEPNAAADSEEVTALAKLVAKAGGIYTTHMRDERAQVIEALNEAFSTSKEAGVSVVISHHKCAGPENHGRSVETLALIEQASQEQQVDLDVYPYAAGSTVLNPKYVDEGFRVMLSWSEAYPQHAGRDISDIAEEWNCSQKEAAVWLQPAGAIYFSTNEEDVQRILAYPKTMVGSDGLPHDEHPHPRLWGTFPRVLGHYSRDVGLFSLEQAVHKMTGIPAATFGLKDRGAIAVGHFADLVVFDPKTIKDTATFLQPKQQAAGIDSVIVNGVVSWKDGKATSDRSGIFIRRHS